jgi:hypothetical protein
MDRTVQLLAHLRLSTRALRPVIKKALVRIHHTSALVRWYWPPSFRNVTPGVDWHQGFIEEFQCGFSYRK